MRITLPESLRPRSRGVGGTSVSVMLHAGLIGGVVAAGGLRAEPKVQHLAPPPLIYVRPVTPPMPRPTLPSGPSAPQPKTPSHEVQPIPKVDLQAVADPKVIPETLPLINTLLGAIVESRATLPGSIASDSGAGHGGGGGGDQPLSAFAVEREVRVIGNVALRYPTMLQSAGISGEVTMQYVVDTLGTVEKGSVRVVSATHPLFAQAARDALVRMRFSPAEVGRQKVRQLVEQRFGFEVK